MTSKDLAAKFRFTSVTEYEGFASRLGEGTAEVDGERVPCVISQQGNLVAVKCHGGAYVLPTRRRENESKFTSLEASDARDSFDGFNSSTH